MVLRFDLLAEVLEIYTYSIIVKDVLDFSEAIMSPQDVNY